MQSVARAAGANAALGGASDAVGQLGTTVGTDQGAQLNPATIADSAALSGVTAGGLKGLGAIGLLRVIHKPKRAFFKHKQWRHKRINWLRPHIVLGLARLGDTTS